MTEFVAPFFGVGGSFKPSVETLIPMIDLIPQKTTESMGYDVKQSD